RTLIDLGLIEEKSLISILQMAYGLETLDLKKHRPEPGVADVIPRAFAEKHRVLAVRREGANTLIVAMEDPSDFTVLDAIRQQTGAEVKPFIATSDQVNSVLESEAKTRGIYQSHRGPRTRLNRAIHATIFYVVLLAPLISFLLFMKYNQAFLS